MISVAANPTISRRMARTFKFHEPDMDANPPEVNSVQYHMEQKSALRVLPLNRADFVSAEQGAYEGGQWKPRHEQLRRTAETPAVQ